MKRIIALLLAVVMVFGLAACGGSEGKNESGEKTYKVAFILNCSISDGGWGTACYSELVAAVEASPNWEMAYTDNLAQDGYYDAMVAYCNEGFDLI